MTRIVLLLRAIDYEFEALADLFFMPSNTTS
jgi:hypothetical protein